MHEDNDWGITLVSSSDQETPSTPAPKEGLEYAYETTPTVDVCLSGLIDLLCSPLFSGTSIRKGSIRRRRLSRTDEETKIHVTVIE